LSINLFFCPVLDKLEKQLYHLHPLTCGELSFPDQIPKIDNIFNFHSSVPGIDDLLKFGGFPEPFVKQSAKEHCRG
jgi:hypothetical protein